jgi:hypothetical protein
MAFDKEKCKIMHVGHNNLQHAYYMQATRLAEIEEKKDVGAIISYTAASSPPASARKQHQLEWGSYTS